MLIRHTRLAFWRATSLISLCLTVALYFLLARSDWGILGARSFDTFDYKTHNTAWKHHAAKLGPFWKELATSLEAARPRCPPVNVTDEDMSAHDKNWEPLKNKSRPNRLILPQKDEMELMRAHRQMRIAARRLGATLPVGENTGIVTTGGLELFPILLVSLRMLRRTGCTLPVQVFLGDQAEYEAVAPTCEHILPGLNARCHIVSDIYSQAVATPPEHFQFKVLAILFSSFQHVLFLDADAFPAHDPTPLLNAPPYTTHGLVTWSGFYANAASPHFYHIAGIPEPPVNRGTESGQLLLNKEHHRESLMMMVYYNYYGPEYYYPLQAQGGPGQGDKETFSAGTMAVNAPGPYYAVKTPVSVLGSHVNGEFIFAGAAQADPIQDYQYEPPPPNHLLPKYQWDKDDKIGAEQPEKAKARALFVHTVSQGTKLNPTKLLSEGGLAWDANDNWHRIWGTEQSMVQNFGFDVEKRMWECVAEEACRIDETLCTKVKSYYKKVFRLALKLK